MEERELKKLLSSIKDIKSKEINDYDGALLNSIFENVRESPREQFNDLCGLLVKVCARIERHCIEKKLDRPDILSKVDAFLNSTKLPNISTSVEDSEQKEGRIITLNRGDISGNISCPSDPTIFSRTVDGIREEQYFTLSNKVKLLLYKAIAFLDEKVIPWHGEDMITEVEIDGS